MGIIALFLLFLTQNEDSFWWFVVFSFNF